MPQKVLLLATFRTAQPQVHHTGQLRTAQRLAPDGLQNFRLVALRQPHDLARGRGRQQTHAQIVPRLGSQPLDQRQPPAYPALMTSQQLRHLHLAHSVFPHQRLNDPGFF